MWQISVLSLRLWLIFFIQQSYLIMAAKDSGCFQPKLIKISWNDTPPAYVVQMNFTNEGSVRILTTVNKDIASPVTRMALIQRDLDTNKNMTMFNVSAKYCDFLGIINKVPMFKDIAQISLKQSNFSFKCPLKVGVYSIEHLRIPSRSPLLRFLYRPKRTLIVEGGMFEELQNKTIRPLNTYVQVVKIVKIPCGRRNE